MTAIDGAGKLGGPVDRRRSPRSRPLGPRRAAVESSPAPTGLVRRAALRPVYDESPHLIYLARAFAGHELTPLSVTTAAFRRTPPSAQPSAGSSLATVKRYGPRGTFSKPKSRRDLRRFAICKWQIRNEVNGSRPECPLSRVSGCDPHGTAGE